MTITKEERAPCRYCDLGMRGTHRDGCPQVLIDAAERERDEALKKVRAFCTGDHECHWQTRAEAAESALAAQKEELLRVVAAHHAVEADPAVAKDHEADCPWLLLDGSRL